VAPEVLSGRVFSFKGTFGFLEYDRDGAKPRLYFSANDVEGGAGITLKPGDEVTFVIASKASRTDAEKEKSAAQSPYIARRVTRTKVCPPLCFAAPCRYQAFLHDMSFIGCMLECFADIIA
jgi:cold shock CspA family protein